MTGVQDILFKPSSRWTPPSSFPNIREKIIGLDIETKDPHLSSRGPGFIRGDASIAGVSVGTFERGWYFPIGHAGGGNLAPEAVLSWVSDAVKEAEYVCGANLMYELEGLHGRGINLVDKKLIDVQVAEALLDEESEQGYELGVLGQKYLGKGKDESKLLEALKAYGLKDKGDMWQLPAHYVGEYGEWDAWAPLQIFRHQESRLREQDLLPIFQLECELQVLLWKMRLKGVPIAMDRAEQLQQDLLMTENQFFKQMELKYGERIDPWSGPKIARICDKLGITYPRTDVGNPSFVDDFISRSEHKFLQDICELRELNKLRTTFVQKQILDNQVKGRIHPQWKQLKRDDGGTRTGRMACSNPNMQQVPAAKRRDGTVNEVGIKIRSLFISDTGKWAKLDYSQQEPRILVHFAAMCKFRGAEAARDAYVKDPKMDFYQLLVEMAGINRRVAKNMYLGRCYGMGKLKMAQKLGKTQAECEQILRDFDAKVPFVKEIAESCANKASARGFIRTLLGRRRHFELYEPMNSFELKKQGVNCMPVGYEHALRKWLNQQLKRAGTHKALNALIQGSAADMIKAAMLQINRQTDIVPYLTVHDEIDCPVNGPEEAAELQNVMQSCVEMTVPLVSELELGEHWK